MLKRESEFNCPTDVRQTVPWCAGEDAIFHCPCHPAYEFYGYKPTCWGDWPTSGAEWRDTYCCSPFPVEYGGEFIQPGVEYPVPVTPQMNDTEKAPGQHEQLPPTSGIDGRRLPPLVLAPEQPGGGFRYGEAGTLTMPAMGLAR